MKKWEKPEVTNLTVGNTNEETCYCEQGEALAASTGERKPSGGHHHKPPHQGGHCPDKPVDKPVHPLPDGDENDWIVPAS
ncbi:hypothetical protein [Turicibacter sanguinis]|uniref:hypothetical protein n=1 Tax=Turicibacter sanguinis TaxID=154288 RepID=UPI0018AA9380|nr:hypothetical protein [Turicibacter sanguinis]MDB8558244.1 hypothetical protein [Turicibacter sanguinis]MDB8561020.1 hypothetical protein [Turicibacter sanguinis]